MYRSAFLILLSPTLSIAGDPLECVDPDFVQAFLSGPGSTPPSYSTELPVDFEVLELPSDMRLIGSRKKQSSTTVAYSIDQNIEEAYARLAGALSDDGWIDVTYKRSPSRRGFRSGKKSLVAEYCRDADDVNLALIASEHSGRTFISIEQYDRRTLRGCTGTLRGRDRDLLDQIPILDSPDGARTSNAGIGTDGNEVSTRVDLSASGSREELLGFFGNQVRNQNWKFQTGWSSERSSGSVWTKDTPEHGVLIGTLHVYDAGGDPVRVRFSIDTADPARGIDHGMSSSSSGGCN